MIDVLLVKDEYYDWAVTFNCFYPTLSDFLSELAKPHTVGYHIKTINREDLSSHINKAGLPVEDDVWNEYDDALDILECPIDRLNDLGYLSKRDISFSKLWFVAEELK